MQRCSLGSHTWRHAPCVPTPALPSDVHPALCITSSNSHAAAAAPLQGAAQRRRRWRSSLRSSWRMHAPSGRTSGMTAPAPAKTAGPSFGRRGGQRTWRGSPSATGGPRGPCSGCNRGLGAPRPLHGLGAGPSVSIVGKAANAACSPHPPHIGIHASGRRRSVGGRVRRAPGRAARAPAAAAATAPGRPARPSTRGGSTDSGPSSRRTHAAWLARSDSPLGVRASARTPNLTWDQLVGLWTQMGCVFRRASPPQRPAPARGAGHDACVRFGVRLLAVWFLLAFFAPTARFQYGLLR